MDTINDKTEKEKNLFINFYIMRFVWKKYGKSIDGLFKALNVNRSLFDRIYRLEDIAKLDTQAKGLADITGLDPSYFRGGKYIEVSGISPPMWENFMASTMKRRKLYHKPEYHLTPLKDQLEIEKYLIEAINNPSKQSYSFNTINYFLKNDQKKRDDTAENIVSEIEAGIKELTLGRIQKLPPELFDRHKTIILDYAQKLYSLGVIEAWKKDALK